MKIVVKYDVYLDVLLVGFIYATEYVFFPRATSEGFLLCASSAGAELPFLAACRWLAAGLRWYRNVSKT